MDELNRVFDKLDKIDERLNSIDKTLVSQHETLKDHTRRSLASEEAVKILKDELKPIILKYNIDKIIFRSIMAIIGSGLFFEIFRLLASKAK